MSYITPFYKGFRLETLVYREIDAFAVEGKRDRTFGVAVKISRSTLNGPAASESKVFRLQCVPFESIGEARRAGDAYGQSLVDGSPEGSPIHEL